ncbi:MAG: tyrosine-type recombinase/integrase [Verrucomicrobiota bacterium]
MKTRATASNAQIQKKDSTTHEATFAKVLDGRKLPIRALWIRNGRYYGQLAVEDTNTGVKKVRRVPLLDSEGEPVQSVAQGVSALEKLRTQRADDDLPKLGQTPTFKRYAEDYLEYIRSGVGTKKAGTIAKEDSTLTLWKAHLGSLRLDKIKPVHVSAFIQKRLKAGLSKRTAKLDVIALRNVLKRARDIDQHIRSLPIPPGLNGELKSSTPKRSLFTQEQLEKLCAAALGKKEDGSPVTKNGQEFSDYVRFMAYCGARRNEALAIHWNDVDFEREQLTIGATGDTKNLSARVVDFNPKLKEHLQAMHKRQSNGGGGVSQWLFPSPQRGDKDIPAQSFRESLDLARTEAKMPSIAFHDLRHHFISYAVMSGIDYMTIAKWVGHRDGGILIGKVYGHLSNEHAKTQAQRMNFGPAILSDAVRG